MTLVFTNSTLEYIYCYCISILQLVLGIILRKKSIVFVYTAMAVLCVEHANVLKLC